MVTSIGYNVYETVTKINRYMNRFHGLRSSNEMKGCTQLIIISVSPVGKETETTIWVQGSICYRGYGSVKSTVLFEDF